MKKSIFILLAIGWITPNVFSQKNTCKTIPKTDEEMEEYPWFGNNAYLEHLADSIGLFNQPTYKSHHAINDVPSSMYKVPIQFWVYRDNNGNDNGLNEVYIQNELDFLNEHNLNNGTQILFYRTCDIMYIDNDDYLNLSEDEEKDIIKDNHIEGVINVHIVRDFESAGVFWQFLFKEGIIVQQNVSNSTLAHEIGHYFSLEHTHRNHDKGKCRQESVSRSRKISFFCGCVANCTNCEKRGDGFCDTPADPNLNSGASTSGCTFTNASATDEWGDTYLSNPPDTRNIMSYMNPRGCRDNFTSNQITAMVDKLLKRGFGHNSITQPVERYLFDHYEPDNFSTTAREITLNSIQHHTFHWSKESKDEVRTCDRDWLWFEISAADAGKPISIVTDDGFYEDANTEIFVYAATDLVNHIAYDDNSNGNNYSRVVLESPAQGRYFIQVNYVDNPPFNSVIDYIIELRECLPDFECVSGVVKSGETKYYYAKETLTSPCPGETFVVESGAHVVFVSEEKIELKDGFTVEQGGTFETVITEIGEDACLNNSIYGKIMFKHKNHLSIIPSNVSLNQTEIKQFIDEPAYENIKKGKMKIYPNPANGKVNINLTEIANGHLSILSICGSVFKIRPINDSGDYEMDISGMQNGIYLVEFVSESGDRMIDKLIVQ